MVLTASGWGAAGERGTGVAAGRQASENDPSPLSSARVPAGPADTSGGFSDVVARAVSGRVRALDAARAGVLGKLDRLPPLVPAPRTDRVGYHSPYLTAPDVPLWVQIDLRQSVPIDAVALIPAEEGYGFPRRFRVQVSDDPGFDAAATVADHTAADLPNPGRYPHVVPVPGRRARYVRVTSARHWKREGGPWVMALGEIIVLSGERNVSAGGPVTASHLLQSPPAWSAKNLVDGQSPLGLPATAEPSPTNGFHAAFSPTADVDQWVQVDLGTPRMVSEIRLIPAHPADFADVPGYGFPVRFRVETSVDPGFASATTVADHTRQDYLNPGSNPVFVRCGELAARVVRVTATRTRPFGQGDRHAFALAELQVISGDRNVAAGGRATASDQFSFEPRPLWEPAYLTDGFASRNRLTGLAGWLRDLAARGTLERASAGLLGERRAAADAVVATAGRVGAGAAGLLVVGGGVLTANRRRARRRHIAALREQIAADLHDEIGSDLGSIALISQLAAEGKAGPGGAAADLAEISRIVTQASESMRAIVWLLNSGDATRRDLVRHLTQVARVMLPGHEIQWRTADACPDARLPLPARRHLLLAFKETLNNVARHARASRVAIDFAGDARTVRFTVGDDGAGYDSARCEAGQGTASLRRRAAALGGNVRVRTAPGAGTTVEFEARVGR